MNMIRDLTSKLKKKPQPEYENESVDHSAEYSHEGLEKEEIDYQLRVAFDRLKRDPKFGPVVAGIVVFGSLAANNGQNFTPDSDIDLLLVTNPVAMSKLSNGDERKERNLCSDMGEIYKSLLPAKYSNLFDTRGLWASTVSLDTDPSQAKILQRLNLDDVEIITDGYGPDIESLLTKSA